MTLTQFLVESAIKRTIHQNLLKGLLKDKKIYYASDSLLLDKSVDEISMFNQYKVFEEKIEKLLFFLLNKNPIFV